MPTHPNPIPCPSPTSPTAPLREQFLHLLGFMLILPFIKPLKQNVLDNQHNTHTPFNGPFPGLPRWAGTRNVKPIWISLKQETVSGSDISWAICKSAPCSRETTTPAPHHSFFTGRMPFLPPNQQRQSTEGIIINIALKYFPNSGR